MKTKSGEIKLLYISAKGYVKVGAVEVFKEKDANQIRVYYVDGGEVKRYSIKGFSECNNCVWPCTFQCIAQDCAPYTPGVCSLCHPLLQCCLPAPVLDNPCCAGAIICYGAIATGCHLWCIYDCNQRGECP